MAGKIIKGACLCGSVRFEVEKPLRPVVSCYCSECRTSSGNFVSATGVPEKRFRLVESGGLAWYENHLAKRGFCRQCGSSLFWKPLSEDGAVRIMAGCLERETGLKVAAHIFVDDRADFQEIAGSAPMYQHDVHGIDIPD